MEPYEQSSDNKNKAQKPAKSGEGKSWKKDGGDCGCGASEAKPVVRD